MYDDDCDQAVCPDCNGRGGDCDACSGKGVVFKSDYDAYAHARDRDANFGVCHWAEPGECEYCIAEHRIAVRRTIERLDAEAKRELTIPYAVAAKVAR